MQTGPIAQKNRECSQDSTESFVIFLSFFFLHRMKANECVTGVRNRLTDAAACRWMASDLAAVRPETDGAAPSPRPVLGRPDET